MKDVDLSLLLKLLLFSVSLIARKLTVFATALAPKVSHKTAFPLRMRLLSNICQWVDSTIWRINADFYVSAEDL